MEKKKIYETRVGAPFRREDAQEIGEFFEKHRDKTTSELLDTIRKNRTSAVYNYIEWDDKKAGEQFRLQQVRNIINHITIRITAVGSRIPVRAFFSVQKSPEENKNIYVSLNSVFSDEYYRDQIIGRALVELEAWIERNRQYRELTNIIINLEPLVAEKIKSFVRVPMPVAAIAPAGAK